MTRSRLTLVALWTDKVMLQLNARERRKGWKLVRAKGSVRKVECREWLCRVTVGVPGWSES